ncbi:MAG: hypothetical protein B7X93_10895 [Hydrogenophilales bacterium 17-61-9]|nr:MAG: hypothetical protein B7X93_10895 [Hydrogenophilales bacterium 17-61-9]
MSSPCVIARLANGLGNHIFMYAFNRAMTERNNVPLKKVVIAPDKRWPNADMLPPNWIQLP